MSDKDTIYRQDAIDAMNQIYCHVEMIRKRPVTKGEQALFLDMRETIKGLPSAQLNQLDETRLSQGIWTKVCKITDSEGLQHEVIHYGDLKAVIEEVTGWMI